MQRILVVDDERLIADTLSLILRKHGFDARATYSADEALRCAEDFLPELLLCDITMPQKDGVSLMQDMVLRHPDCRLLVLTGCYSNLKRVWEEMGPMLRPAGILTKPCQPSDLLREASNMLASA